MGKKKTGRKTVGIPLRLKDRRKAKGWSQARLAEATGVSDATINRIEQGKQNWDQDFLQNAADALECLPADLLPPEYGSVTKIFEGAAQEDIDAVVRLLGNRK